MGNEYSITKEDYKEDLKIVEKTKILVLRSHKAILENKVKMTDEVIECTKKGIRNIIDWFKYEFKEKGNLWMRFSFKGKRKKGRELIRLITKMTRINMWEGYREKMVKN